LSSIRPKPQKKSKFFSSETLKRFLPESLDNLSPTEEISEEDNEKDNEMSGENSD
jgi:hypothetical protein